MKRPEQNDRLAPETVQLAPGEKPTLITLSRHGGLAVTTVSRALGDAADISEATKAQARGISFRAEDKTDGDSPSDQVRACVKNRRSETPEVDGYISSSARAAMAVVGAFEEVGRKLGDDVQLFTTETVPILSPFRKEIIVVPENVDRAGAFVARAAVQAIRAPDKPPMQGLEVPHMPGADSKEEELE